MEFPQLPTDSFYKFVAILGLALIVCASGIMIFGVQRLKVEALEHAFKVQAQLDEHMEAQLRLGSELNSLPQERQIAFQQLLERHKKNVEGVNLYLKAAASEFKFSYWLMTISTSVMIIAGPCLCYWGLMKWYRLQLIHDEILRIELAAMQKRIT